MSFNLNRFNIYGDDFINHRMNHEDLFDSPPSFSSSQNSHASSSSFQINNSHMNYHMMRRNFDSFSGAKYFSIRNNSHITQIYFTETIKNRYTTIVPTNTLDNFQHEIKRVKRSMDSNTNIWNPVFYPQIFFDNQCEILNPTPLSVIYPRQHSAALHHLDFSSFTSKCNHVPHASRSSKKISKPTNLFERTTYYVHSEEDEKSDDNQYDGRTHSIPYVKYGPYTCPKCNGVFDTSQRFAAHMLSHYNSETNKEKALRFCARNKRKYRKLMAGLKISKQRM
ncbi:unnamed protein product [Arabidopsis lyrata]|nr:unnamed protein product [Arabidopsis lyrata]